MDRPTAPIPPPLETSSWRSSATCAKVSSRCTTRRCRRAIFHVYLHPADMERLRGILPRIVGRGAARAGCGTGNAEPRIAGRAVETGAAGQRKDRGARRRVADPHSGEHGRRCRSRAISPSRRNWRCPAKDEFGAGSMTKRIATRRMGGVESTKQSYDPAPAAGARPRARSGAFAVIEYEDSSGPQDLPHDQRRNRGGPRRARILDGHQAGHPARRIARTLPPAPRSGERAVFPEGPEPAGHDDRRREGALQHRDRGRREARPQPGGAGAGARAHRPGGRGVTWSSEAHRMVKTKRQVRGGQRPRPRAAATTRTRSTSTRSAASSWWWTASAGRPRARRRRKSRWSACARAWSARPARVEQRVREAITMANNEILRRRAPTPNGTGMACVLTLAVLENGSAVVGHVGDSRLYQVRARRDPKDHARSFARWASARTIGELARRRPCGIRAATKSFATWAARSTRRTIPISSK